MSILGSDGILSYGIQSAKGSIATTFYRHKAMGIDYGAQQQQQVFPLEVGGFDGPTGAYKSGAFMAGGATLNPRMEGDFGWLLKGLLGTVTTQDAIASENGVHASIALSTGSITTGITNPPASRKLVLKVTASAALAAGTGNVVLNGPSSTPTETINVRATAYVAGEVKYFYGSTAFSTLADFTIPTAAGLTMEIGYVAESGVKDHIFTPGNAASFPWLTVRKYIPGVSTPLGEIGLDNRVASVNFTFPNGGIIQSRVDFLGREPAFAPSPSWTYADATEDTDSVPLTCKVGGFLKLPGFSAAALPIIGAQVSFSNQLTTPDQEKIIGSPYPDDITRVSKAMTFQGTLKWNDPDLYEYILTNGSAGVAWSPTVYYSDLHLKVEAPVMAASGGAVPYRLQVKAPRCAIQVQGSPQLAAGQMIMLPVMGQVVESKWGDYCQFILTNSQANYS